MKTTSHVPVLSGPSPTDSTSGLLKRDGEGKEGINEAAARVHGAAHTGPRGTREESGVVKWVIQAQRWAAI